MSRKTTQQTINQTIGLILRAQRQWHHQTQHQLSKNTEIPLPTIIAIEHNRQQPTKDQLHAIMEETGLTTTNMLTTILQALKADHKTTIDPTQIIKQYL